MISHLKLRTIFAGFWQSKGHVEVPGIPLIPQNDPTTLFTGSGMQQLVPNLLGEPHPLGTRLYNIQRCVRAQDIDEVGDNRHDTFFEMMGNWSLGDYFKNDQLRWVFDLYTDKDNGFGLDPSKLYVTVFGGGEGISQDDESIDLWKILFAEHGMAPLVGTSETFHAGQHITLYGADKNWWSRSGTPHHMPTGEVGGPDSEIFYDFGAERELHENSPYQHEKCHVNCDCGRFLEIGNSVFVQYVKLPDGSLKELPNKNVDFGGGLERVIAAMNNDPDVFKTDVLWPIVETLHTHLHKQYGFDGAQDRTVRIVADHIRTAVELTKDGVVPGPKEQGYLLRRLIRRAFRMAKLLHIDHEKPMKNIFAECITSSLVIYEPIDSSSFVSTSTGPNTVILSPTKYDASPIPFDDAQGKLAQGDNMGIVNSVMCEIDKYLHTFENGKKIIAKYVRQKPILDGTDVFNLYQSIGVPTEEVIEMVKEQGGSVNMDGFEEAKQRHSTLSRSGGEQKFKGGLADQSEQVVKYHTATHLLHQALCDVLGDSVRQEGSNITGERLRFDFRCDHRPTPEDFSRVSTVIQSKIQDALPVHFVMIPKHEAEKLGAKSFFKEKYPDIVKVYIFGATQEEIQKVVDHPDDCRLTTAYSLEFCGGPHVSNTKEIGIIELYKTEKIGKDLYRVYGK